MLGAFIVIFIGLLAIWGVYKWIYGGLKERIVKSFSERQDRKSAIITLPEDMDFVREELARLREHTGLCEIGEGETESEAEV